jgi:hypothetical protein
VEAVPSDLDVVATTFRLHCVARQIVKPISGDQPVVASDVIDPTTGGSSTAVRKLRKQYPIVIEARELQTVLVASSTDIVDRQAAKCHVMSSQWVVIVATVITVDSVGAGTFDLEIVDHDELGMGEMHPLCAADKLGPRLSRCPPDPDR